MKVAPVRSNEVEDVFSLWRIACADTYNFLKVTHTEEEDRDYFTKVILKDNDVWVAIEGDEVLGFLAIAGDYIDRLYVHPVHQRKKVGSFLMEQARRISPDRLRLCTHVENEGARSFYEHHGFEAVRFGVSPPPESEPDVEYLWKPAVR